MASKRARKIYSAEFKLEAVRRMHERRRMGISLAQISGELEVRADSLRQWERAHGLAPAPSVSSGSSADEELRRLRRELDTMRMERDFLKKARRTLPKNQSEVRLHCAVSPGVSVGFDVPRAASVALGLSQGPAARPERAGAGR